MLTYDKVRLNNLAWQVFYRLATQIQVIAPDDMQEAYMRELRKTRTYRLVSIRTKHDYRTGKLVAFAIAYGNYVDKVHRDVFISESAVPNDIAELKFRCTADFSGEEARAAA